VDATAPTKNVTLFRNLIKRLEERGSDDTGFGVFCGPSGYGKTRSATFTAARMRAHYIRVADAWGAKSIADALCQKLGLKPRGTVSAAVNDIVEQLSIDPDRPIIFDEADYIVKKGKIDFIRDLLDMSGAAIILIGEELLPQKLQKFERTANRVLTTVHAQPTNLEEAKMFATLYAPGVTIKDELLSAMIEAGHGRARRIIVNIQLAKQAAVGKQIKAIGLAEWGSAQFYDNAPPKRRPV
jgi:DNA transposition AAA+ family ATPase